MLGRVYPPVSAFSRRVSTRPAPGGRPVTAYFEVCKCEWCGDWLPGEWQESELLGIYWDCMGDEECERRAERKRVFR